MKPGALAQKKNKQRIGAIIFGGETSILAISMIHLSKDASLLWLAHLLAERISRHERAPLRGCMNVVRHTPVPTTGGVKR